MIKENVLELINQVFIKELHLFERNGNIIAFGKNSSYLKILSDLEYNFLSLMKKGFNIEQISNETNIDEYNVSKSILEIFDGIKSQKIIKSKLEAPNSIQLIISDACNMKCSYCYGNYYTNQKDKHLMDLQTAFKAIDFAESLGISNIGFFGGEPLLNFSLINEVVNYCQQKRLQFKFGMTTNGTLITNEIAEFARKNNILVSVSIDGDYDTHNLSRKYPNGNNTYNDVIEGVNLLKSKNCLYMLEMTYSKKHSKDLKTILNNLSKVHNCLSCTCVEGRSVSSFSDEIIQGDRMIAFYNDMFDFFIENKTNSIDITLGGMNELVSSLISDYSISKEYICTSIMHRISIGIHGDIYPCPETMSNNFRIANVMDTDLVDTFNLKRRTILEKLKKETLKEYWFSNITDICYARICENGEKKIEDSISISKAIEDILYKVAIIKNS